MAPISIGSVHSSSADSCSEFSSDYFSPDEDDVDSDSASTSDVPTLADDVYSFFSNFNVPVAGMKFLLTALNKHGISGVPKSLYRLRQVTNSRESKLTVQQLDSGLYSYIGIKDNLATHFSRVKIVEEYCKESTVNIVNMRVNVDGLPLYRSSTVSIWPILVAFGSDRQCYPVALHFGRGKPTLDSFLDPFIQEVLMLRSDGLCIGNVQVKLGEVTFVCDAPARAHLQCILGHTAKKGCSHCDAEGRYISDRVVFPAVAGNPRTDEKYNRFEENNQVRLSPLTQIVGLKTNFPVDELHCICLGVVRKMFHFLFSKVKKSTCRLKDNDVQLLSEDILNFRKYTPAEFQRQVRSIKTDLMHFKGTEFRSFLLYFGPFLFKKYLSEKVYHLFILLHFSYYVFSSENYVNLHGHAHRCLEIFVKRFSDVFGEQSLSYNVHMLLHLHECVRRYGPLKSFSTFTFENYLGKLKRRVKVTRYAFSHILNQVRNVPCSLQSSQLRFTTQPPNNFALFDGHVVKIDSVLNDGTVIGKTLTFRKDVYSYPYNSKQLRIGYYALSRKTVKGKPLNKAIAFPSDDEFVIFPLV